MLERTHDPSRVLALSDGVFAIVITLLVLEVHVPELSQGQSLTGALAEVRPSFNAFVITFILTGMYWVAHRDLFTLIRRIDRGLVWLNILYLLPLCLLPFGAGMLGRYEQEPVALSAFSVIVYLVAEVAPGASLLIYAAMPVLYILSVTVLRSSRKRDQEYADFT
ncbi:MAG TPA: TMEM175 family protein [Actinomycetes bacterium]|nr:TMEM175 family protein [Actinomycetes bacterium]